MTGESTLPGSLDVTRQGPKTTTPPGIFEQGSHPQEYTNGGESSTATQQKKKKRKKPKKSASAKAKEKTTRTSNTHEGKCRLPLLCISRNKHWRYISSYHGPWLQLPLEILESLMILNTDPTTLAAESRMAQLLPSRINSHYYGHKSRDRGPRLNDPLPSGSSYNSLPPLPSAPLLFPKPGKAAPFPIDPGVFRSVTTIRELIDEAAELSVRASSGLSAAELSSMTSGPMNGSAWTTAQSLGLNPLGTNNGRGRHVAISAIRIHRLRALAVQKLAEAYKTDEIASSVMVMQGGSVFDDLAERVLRVDPSDPDARYVHFFHEKIPSRQLAESTTTKVLDELITQYPQRLQYFRTRGIVECFREEFGMATKDFTHALKEARAIRKAKQIHHTGSARKEIRSSNTGKRRKNGSSSNCNGQAPPDGTSALDECSSRAGGGGDGGGGLILHPLALPDTPDPIEPQLLFLRGAAYLQNAIHLIESAVLGLEGVRKEPTLDGAELRLSYIENGKYGGVEIGNPEGPLGSNQGAKVQAYNRVLGGAAFREQINTLLRKSMRDHQRFLVHFDTLESSTVYPDGDIATKVEYAFQLSEAKRPLSDVPPVFTTYHPLLVESMYSILICLLMTADFSTLLAQFIRTAVVVDGLEGYPIFLPPRSMGQAEFMELLERLAGGWKNGVQQHSFSIQRGKARLAIKAPLPVFPRTQIFPSRTSSTGSSTGSPPNPSSSSSLSRKASFVKASSSLSSSSNPDSPTAPHVTDGTATPSSCWDFADSLEDDYPAGSCSRSRSSSISPPSTPSTPCPNVSHRPDIEQALDCARILLSPVVKRQKEKAEKLTGEKEEKGNGGGKNKKNHVPINIPLHGPRVEVVLAWLGAVHLPELDG